jgi:putative methionine-R-sulfoxide reductase with GAF domain
MPTQVVTARPPAESGSLAPGAVRPISPGNARIGAKSIAYAVEALRAQLDRKLANEAFVHNVAEQARALTGAIGAVIAFRQEGAVVCVASCGAVSPVPGTPVDTHGGISGECLRSGKPLYCSDSENDPRIDALLCRTLGLRSIAAAPILEDGKVAGLVEVFAEEPNAFDDQSMEVLKSLAELLEESRTPPAENRTEAATTAPDPVEAGWLRWPAIHPYQAAVVAGLLLLDILTTYACYHR